MFSSCRAHDGKLDRVEAEVGQLVRGNCDLWSSDVGMSLIMIVESVARLIGRGIRQEDRDIDSRENSTQFVALPHSGLFNQRLLMSTVLTSIKFSCFFRLTTNKGCHRKFVESSSFEKFANSGVRNCKVCKAKSMSAFAYERSINGLRAVEPLIEVQRHSETC